MGRRAMAPKTFSFKVIKLFENVKERYEIVPFYQPIIGNDTNKIIGVEVLCRLRSLLSENVDLLCPEDFLKAIEENCEIIPVTKILLDKTKYLLQQNLHELPQSFTVFLNLSRVHLYHDNVLDFANDCISFVGNFDDINLVIEVTECIPLEMLPQLELLATITSATQKISFALDDFGMGCSNLDFILKFNFSFIKVNSFFYFSESFARHFLSILLSQAPINGMSVIVENVEEKEVFDYFKNMGAYGYQGYLFSSPADEKEIIEYIINFNNSGYL